MTQPYQDSHNTSFHSLADMMTYHAQQTTYSRWDRTEVTSLHVEPLGEDSPLYDDLSVLGANISEDAVRDTTRNLGLAVRLNGLYFPLRDTAFKSLTDRAKISGTVLPKLPRQDLADVLNACLVLQRNAQALLLIREQKITAAHSGDERDYAILPIDKLMESLKSKLDERFPGSVFENGYSDHALTSAAWPLSDQREDLLGTYRKTLSPKPIAKYPLCL